VEKVNVRSFAKPVEQAIYRASQHTFWDVCRRKRMSGYFDSKTVDVTMAFQTEARHKET
jgi:hypothetical protein